MRVLYQGQQLGDVNAARFSWERSIEWNAAGEGVAFNYRANFGEINFAVTDQADCQVKMGLIDTALSLPYGDLLVKNDNDTNSANSVLSAATFGGVKPTSLTWTDRPGAQFHTWRQFSCSFEWSALAAGVGVNTLVDFHETVTVRGGTPRQIVNEPINVATSALDEQIVIPQQKYIVTQSGRAVGLLAYPNLALWAPALYPNPNDNPITLHNPRRDGSNYRDYAVEWMYTWEFAVLGSLPIPNVW